MFLSFHRGLGRFTLKDDSVFLTDILVAFYPVPVRTGAGFFCL
jgi:hypothetical protein